MHHLHVGIAHDVQHVGSVEHLGLDPRLLLEIQSHRGVGAAGSQAVLLGLDLGRLASNLRDLGTLSAMVEGRLTAAQEVIDAPRGAVAELVAQGVPL